MQVTLGQHPAVMERLAGRNFSGRDLNMLKPAPDHYLRAGMRYASHGSSPALQAEAAELFSDMAILPKLLGL